MCLSCKPLGLSLSGLTELRGIVEVTVVPGRVVVLGGTVIGGDEVLEGVVVVDGMGVQTIPPLLATGSVHIGAVVSVVKVGPGSPDGAEYVSVDVGADKEAGHPAVPR
jgi:hypothetical protein